MKEDVAEFFDLFYGYRKFIAFVAVFVTAVILRIKGYVGGSDLTSMVNTTFIAFASGNIAEHWSSVVKQAMTNKNTSVTEIAKDIAQNVGSNS